MDIDSIRAQRKKVNLLGERIECKRADIERITKIYRAMPGGSGAGDKLSGDIAKLVDLQTVYAVEVARLEDTIQRVEKAMDVLPEQQHKVIYLRYIDCLTWPQVAKKATYDRSQCFRIHDAAMEKLKMRLNETV